MKAILYTMAILSLTTLFCDGGITVDKNQTIVELNNKKGIRATIDQMEDAFESAIEISIEIDVENELFDDTSKVDFVLTLIDEKDRCIANLPVDGFKKIHSKPGQKLGFYSLRFTVRRNLLKKSYLTFYDTSKTENGGDGVIYHVYLNDSPPKKKT